MGRHRERSVGAILVGVLVWVGVFDAGQVMAASSPRVTPAPVDASLSAAMACEKLVNEDFIHVADAPASLISTRLVPAAAGMPEYCDVNGYVQPQIGFELRLPTRDWNGRYFQVGCGGLCGMININACSDVLAKNFAVAAQNMGHIGHFWKEPLWGSDPQLRSDYGGRSTHVTAIAAKAVIERYYGVSAAYSYFRGCSTGGREGLFEAQHHPADFNGIIAGDPAFAGHLGPISNNWDAQHLLHKDDSAVFPPGKLDMLHRAVLEQCDALDGLADGIIDDPRACHFDISRVICPDSHDRPDCLTKEQADAADAVYGGVHDSHGIRLFPGHNMYGSEEGWDGINSRDIANAHLKYLGFAINPPTSYTYRAFNFDHDVRKLEATTAIYDPVAPYQAPDLSKFHALGGKLIIYHGWGDQGISPMFVLDYYAKVTSKSGGVDKTRDWFRVFMVPGMRHCRGGEAPNTFDFMPSAMAWVEHGAAPVQVVATEYRNGAIYRTRPIVPYPQVVRYHGSGDVNAAENWSVQDPPKLYDDNITWKWGPEARVGKAHRGVMP